MKKLLSLVTLTICLTFTANCSNSDKNKGLSKEQKNKMSSHLANVLEQNETLLQVGKQYTVTRHEEVSRYDDLTNTDHECKTETTTNIKILLVKESSLAYLETVKHKDLSGEEECKKYLEDLAEFDEVPVIVVSDRSMELSTKESIEETILSLKTGKFSLEGEDHSVSFSNFSEDETNFIMKVTIKNFDVSENTYISKALLPLELYGVGNKTLSSSQGTFNVEEVVQEAIDNEYGARGQTEGDSEEFTFGEEVFERDNINKNDVLKQIIEHNSLDIILE